jgi:hypothetical protein
MRMRPQALFFVLAVTPRPVAREAGCWRAAAARTADYTDGMRSVADESREASRRADAALTPEQRVERALALGDDDLAAYAFAHALASERARHALVRRRRVGRLPSRCVDGLSS